MEKIAKFGLKNSLLTHSNEIWKKSEKNIYLNWNFNRFLPNMEILSIKLINEPKKATSSTFLSALG